MLFCCNVAGRNRKIKSYCPESILCKNARLLHFIALMKSKLNVGMRNVSDKEEKNNPDRSSTMMHYSPEILDVDLVLITVTANSAANCVCF